LAWSSVISEALYPVAERLSGLGYQGVECAMGSRDRKAYKNFGSHAKDLGLEVSCVLALGAETNPISPSSKVRDKALEEIKWAIDRAVDLDARLICGPFHSAFATFSGEP